MKENFIAITKRNRQRNNTKIKTKLIGLVFSFMVLVSSAQIEISGALDSLSEDGVSTAAVRMTFIQAVEACRNLVENGSSDWYLPTVEELWLFCPPVSAIVGSGAGIVGNIPRSHGHNSTVGIGAAHWTRSLRVNQSNATNDIDYMVFNLLGDFAIKGSTTDNMSVVPTDKNLGGFSTRSDSHGYGNGQTHNEADNAYVRCVR